MSNKKLIDESLLLKMYVTDNAKVKDIASHFNVSEATITNNLKKNGIKLRYAGRSNRKKCNDIETLKRMSQDSSLSNLEIAEHFKISYSLLWTWFVEYGINRASVRNNENLKPTKDELELQYQTKSANELSTYYGVTTPTIINWLKSYDIRTRSVQETYRMTSKKMMETNLTRYGTEYTFKNESVKEKIKQSHEAIRDVSYPSQCPFVRLKIEKTNLERYGVKNPLMLVKNQSIGELSMIEALNSMGFDFKSTRSVLPMSYELDGFDEQRKIAVEYNGIYYHSEDFKTRLYHRWKFLECQKQGIKLYTIFEDEWIQKPDKILNFIAQELKSTRIGARKTELREVSKDDTKDFCSKFHIQGSPSNIVKSFGLYYQDVLATLVSFGKHHRDNDQIVLNRMCSLPGISITGGASRLVKHARNVIGQPFITWSDNRFSQGDVYEKVGFIKEADLVPDYTWGDYSKRMRYSKQSRKKSATGQPTEMTEREYNESLGYRRIWDCGKIRWKYL